jgi:hypothetical protein
MPVDFDSVGVNGKAGKLAVQKHVASYLKKYREDAQGTWCLLRANG